MNHQTKFYPRLSVPILALSLAAWPILAAASITEPLYVGNLAPVFNEYRQPMPGSPDPALEPQRPRIEIRTVPFGQWPTPPDYYGRANEGRNPLVSQVHDLGNGADSIGGMGLNAARPNSGIFCIIFPRRPPSDTWIFARVFNAPTLETASFYVDSEPVQIPSRGTSLVVSFGEIQPLDTRDFDGDGLHNSWERSLGTDPENVDTDGDGMSDYEEWLAGTDPLDRTSFLAIRDIRPVAPSAVPGVLGQTEELIHPIRLRWSTAPGRRYQVQHADSLLEEQIFKNVGVVIVAGEGEDQVDTWIDVEYRPAGFFRLKLITDEE